MLHSAAAGKPYACFVDAETRIPFMAMPDAIKSLLMLMNAPRENLSSQVYNIAAFSLSADEFRQRTLAAFPQAQVSFAPNARRQGIVDSWPEDVDDSLARQDWDWKPDYDPDRFFDKYFLPEIRKRYKLPSSRTLE
jgi:nucleoside-diphosphate-sugar epimerase